jgi:hypothetical protein
MSPATHHDPRSIITPDAFDVSEELLGMPLAKPGRRFWALIIDLAVVGFITIVTKSNALILGVAAATFFMRAGFKRTPVKGSVFNRMMHASVGCFGLVIALITAGMVWAFGVNFGGNEAQDLTAMPALVEGNSDNPFAAALGAIAVNALEASFANANDLEDSEEEFLDFVEAAEDMGWKRSQMLDLVLAAIPDDASWAGSAQTRFTALLNGEDVDEAPGDPTVRASLANEIDGLSAEAALTSYAALLASAAEGDEAILTRELLRSRLITEVASDTLAVLEEHIGDLESVQTSQRTQLAAAQFQLDQSNNAGLFNTLRGFVDELGFGFGWASLYMTIVLSWWNGQTVGKKLMRIRVVRLDGEPITWWIAFERAGGYAAGFATGLLGFAQVYWDANRQGIHDRIVGTVVVIEGAEKIEDWESAL